MDKIFLDTNVFMRLLEGRLEDSWQKFDAYQCCISALSIHIAVYVHKLRIPNATMSSFTTHFVILPISNQASKQSLEGPTSDYEDNLQLHTALESNTAQFVTLDKKLLDLKSIGIMNVVSPTQL